VSHPSLGLPPRDETAGFPDAAARLTRDRRRLGQRTMEIAVDRDPTFNDRYDELGMRKLLRDTRDAVRPTGEVFSCLEVHDYRMVRRPSLCGKHATQRDCVGCIGS
jgi:hypothetical protein